MENNKAIIIIPVYEDYDSLKVLLKKITLEGKYYILVVDDGSTQKPVNISLLEENNIEGEIIKIPINIGNQNAIYEGIKYIAKQNKKIPLIIMDGDGEDNPKFIPILLSKIIEEKTHICVALRGTRNESILFKFLYQIYKIVFRILTGVSLKFGNFLAIHPNYISKIASLESCKVHLAATILHSKFKISRIVLNREKRIAGKSKMNIENLIIHGMFALSIFSDKIYVRLILAFSFILILNLVFVILATINIISPEIISNIQNYVLSINSILILISIFLNSILNYGTNKISNNEKTYKYEICKTK